MQSAPEPFNAECSNDEGRCVVALAGELDLQTAPQLEAVVSQALADDPVLLVLDLSALTFIDSSGLRSVLAAHEQAQDTGHGFGMIPGPENVQKLFAIAGLVNGLPWVSERGAPEVEPEPPAA